MVPTCTLASFTVDDVGRIRIQVVSTICVQVGVAHSREELVNVVLPYAVPFLRNCPFSSNSQRLPSKLPQ